MDTSTFSNLEMLIVPCIGNKGRRRGFPRVSIDSLSRDWLGWLIVCSNECSFDESGQIQLPILPDEIVNGCAPPSLGGLIGYDGVKPHPNVPVIADIWCRMSRTYFHATNEKKGHWVSEESRITSGKAFCSASEFAAALIAKYSLPIATVDLADRIVEAAKTRRTYRSEETA